MPNVRGPMFDRSQELLVAEVLELREALRPFAEVPPGSAGYPEKERLRVVSAGEGSYHFLEADLQRAKDVLRRRKD